jgi:hypothetical protein|tara:strand:+ start:3236 stop:3706 length:471 start_codon:yes stop_codon:yes gene_type:complete
MASTITSGTVTVKITETVSLNSTNYDSINTLTIPNVNEVSQRIVTIPPQSITELFKFAATIAPGQFLKTTVQYLRITNKDDTNPVALNIQGATSNTWVRVPAGRSFIIGSSTASMESIATGVVAVPSLADIEIISAYGPTAGEANTVDVECYVALT